MPTWLTYYRCLALSACFFVASFFVAPGSADETHTPAAALTAIGFAFAIGAHVQIGKARRRRVALVIWMTVIILWSLMLIGS